MSCAKPLKLYKEDLKPGKRKNYSDFETLNLQRSLNTRDYAYIPCGYCTNCRIDKQNSIIDRCEYEYIQRGVGAFVTLTYDDLHLFTNSFIDSQDGQTKQTLNKRDAKKFLDNLNKLVHKESKRLKSLGLPITLCQPDYRYILSGEYGDRLKRPHLHCLFFGLDFKYCERLFWRAWKFKGSIEVAPIKNGGIAYVTKYINEQSHGLAAFTKYDSHHLVRPFSWHSTHLGDGLYTSQKKYIMEHYGNYSWHGKTRPVPQYFLKKFRCVSQFDPKYIEERYKRQCENIRITYDITFKTFKDYEEFKFRQSNIRLHNIEKQMRNHGKLIYDKQQIDKELYADSHNRLPDTWDSSIISIVNPNGTKVFQFDKRVIKPPLSTRQLMYLHTDYKKLCRQFGQQDADYLMGFDKNPLYIY